MVRHGLYPERNSRQILRTFELHVFPKLGKYPAHQLTLHNWLTVLDRLAQGYSEITRRVISNGSAIHGRLNVNYLRPTLCLKCLAAISGSRSRWERTLDRKELAIVWRAIEDSRLMERNKILYKLSAMGMQGRRTEAGRSIAFRF